MVGEFGPRLYGNVFKCIILKGPSTRMSAIIILTLTETTRSIQMFILFHRFPLTFDTMLASGDITGIRKMSRLQSQTYYAPSISGGGGGPSAGGTNKFDRQRNLTLKSKSSRGTVEPLGRSSLRSKSSSNSSGDRVKLFKNCVKKIFLFLFTQVGVGAFVVLYTIAGALIFQVSY